MKKNVFAQKGTIIGNTFEIIRRLSEEDRAEFNKYYHLYDGRQAAGAETFGGLAFNEDTSPQTYLEALNCPYCNSKKLIKHGLSDSHNPRYKCLKCLKTFSASTHTLSSNSVQDTGVWMVFIKGLLKGETFNSLAKTCGISITTVRNWRLKVFVALERLAEDVKLSGLVFADDTRIPYNFKGYHGSDFIAPRHSHSRGGQTTMKNHLKNEICVLCALDAHRNSFSRCIGFGNPSGKRLSNGFANKLNVDENMTLITDGAQAFSRTVKDYGIPNWERRVTKTVKGKRFPNTALGDLHIQTINNYHKRLKEFLARYHGVASRFLPGYLLLFDYKENHKHLTEGEQAKEILEAMASISENYTLEALERKFSIPISNGPETELWEVKIPRKEQLAYRDWVNKVPIKDICTKYHIKRRRIYYIRDKVMRYRVHAKIISDVPRQNKVRSTSLLPVSDRNWEIFLYCYRDGHGYTEAARHFGLSRQRVYQIVQKVLSHPSASLIKKYEPPAREKRQKRLPQKEILRDLNLMCDDESTKKENYAILAQSYDTTPRYVGKLFYKQRLAGNDINWTYHWTQERKDMAPQEYYQFLIERNIHIHQDCEDMLLEYPEMTKATVFKQIATVYGLSASSVTSIYYNVGQGILPQFHAETYEPTPSQRDVYYAVIKEKENDPGHSNYEYIRRVAAKRNLLFHSAENYFYKYRKLLRQREQALEQNPASEPNGAVS